MKEEVNLRSYSQGISACVITLNEERRLPPCLEALSFADEIIVLDSGSKDRTREIARAAGARLETRPCDGFVSQKNHVISLAKYSWVMVVDADEVVTPGLSQEILAVKAASERGDVPHTAYRVPRMSYYLGRWIKHCGWYPEYKLRLFQNGSAKFVGGTVHENLKTQGSIGFFKHHLEHYSYQRISDHLERIDYYSDLIAIDKFRRGKKSSVLWALLKGISKFLLTFLWHRGFLDGWPGLAISALGAYYNFLKYLKLWEIQKGLSDPDAVDIRQHPAVRRRVSGGKTQE